MPGMVGPTTSFTIAVVKTWDVIVIGGGIIGLSLSIALRKRGATVLVVERGEPGREASYAAGGMLVDCPLETPRPMPPTRSSTFRTSTVGSKRSAGFSRNSDS